MARWKRYWFIFWKFRALRLMQMFEYRANFFFWSFVSLMWTAFNLFFYDMILRVSNDIAGWDRNEMYVLLGTFTMLDAFTWSMFYHNMSEYARSIFNGNMTMTLTRPIQPQFLISVQGNSYTNAPRFFIGLWILLVGIQGTGRELNIFHWAGYIILFTLALLFIYSAWFIITTLCFWVDRLESVNDVIPSLRRIWQVPKEVYTGIMSTIFTVILPFALISTLPSEVLLGRNSLLFILYFALFTVMLLVVSHFFFKLSVHKYTGTAN